MARFLLWLMATIVLLYLHGAYFEECISKEMYSALTVICGFVLVIIDFIYFYYSIKQLIKYLKLKTK